jgi:hypothetical protein
MREIRVVLCGLRGPSLCYVLFGSITRRVRICGVGALAADYTAWNLGKCATYPNSDMAVIKFILEQRL